MKITKSFVAGVMNKDLDERLIPDGQYVDAMNIQVGSSESTNMGAIENEYGNLKKGTYSHTNGISIGAVTAEEVGCIYWFVKANDANYIYEYNQSTDAVSIVLKDSRPGANNVLNFDSEHLITGVNYINGFLCWTDDYNPPRKINIQRAKSYGVNGFYEDDVNVIVKPPLNPPTIVGRNDSTVSSDSLSDRFLYFGYRYRYVDDEYSSLSPFSEVAFFPKTFAVNGNSGVNEGMLNANNVYDISFNSGEDSVTDIQLIFFDTSKINAYIIETLNKAELKYDDNTVYSFSFSNNKIYAPLPTDQLTRLFDNVPLKAKAQEIIGNRLAYGNYVQFYDIRDCDGVGIFPSFNIELNSETYDELSLNSGSPQETWKSNRDYEFGIVYLDDYGRMTTVQTSPTNSIFIDPSYSDDKNSLRINIYNEAPCFATHYRLAIKQTKGDYYNIYPTFFVEDGSFKYFKINQSDVDKVKTNDYVVFKTDSNGVVNIGTQYKVLDVSYLSKDAIGTGIPSVEGVYIKIVIDNDVSINKDIIQVSKYKGQGANSTDGLRAVTGLKCHRKTRGPVMAGSWKPMVENPIGYTASPNSKTKLIAARGNNFFGTSDIRYKVEITTATGSANPSFNYYIFGSSVPVMASDQVITANTEYSLKDTPNGTDVAYIMFTSTSGLVAGDYWIVNARSANGPNVFGLPTVFDPNKREGGFAIIPSDYTINTGAQIKFKISESQNVQDQPEQIFTSSKTYENLEEWFFEDGIYNNFKMLSGPAVGDAPNTNKGAKSVFFRRGSSLDTGQNDGARVDMLFQDSGTPFLTAKDSLYMVLKGYGDSRKNFTSNALNYLSCERNFIIVEVEVSQLTDSVIIETVPNDTDIDVYHELPYTYEIVDGLHQSAGLSGEQNQTRSSVSTTQKPAIVQIPSFNAFTFGNGAECYRIRDDFNSFTMKYSPRALTTTDKYAEERVKNALTYSGVYQVTSGLNKLNEFNLSNANFKYLDQEFGSIQKLYSRDTDLIVFQENKVSKVLYEKNLLSDSVGGGTVASIPQVLGTQIAYSGEYGISNNPESFAQWGNNVFFTDQRRNAALRLGQDGMFEISSQGMRDWFRDLFIADGDTQKIGAYDPYHNMYVLTSTETPAVACEFDISRNKLLVSKTSSNMYLFSIRSNSSWTITYSAAWLTNVVVSGSGNQDIYGTLAQNNGSTVRSVVLTIAGCSGNESFTLEQSPSSKVQRVAVVVNNPIDATKVATQLYNMTSTGGLGIQFVDTVLKNTSVSLYDVYAGYSGDGQIPLPSETVTVRGYDETTGINGGIAKPFVPSIGNKMYYLVSNTKYEQGDYNALIAASTPITPSLVGGNYDATFSYSNPSNDDYLYLIWDYRSGLSCGTSGSYVGTEGQTSIEYTIGGNIGLVDVSYTVNSGNMRFQIQYDGVVVADSGVVSTSGTLSFVKRTSTPTTALLIITNENIGGGTIDFSATMNCPALIPIEIDPTNGTSSNVCSQTSYGTYYTDSTTGSVDLGARIYTDSAGTTPFNGANAYHRVGPAGNDYTVIDTDGYVISFESCTCSEVAAPTITQSDVSFAPNESIYVSLEASNNPIEWDLVSSCVSYELYGGNSGGVFSGIDCETGLPKVVSVNANETIYSCSSAVFIKNIGVDAISSSNGVCVNEVLPDGISFDGLSGVIYGVSETIGTFEVTVNATNCFGTSADETFLIQVQDESIVLTPFGLDSTGYATSALSCGVVANINIRYHSGEYTFPVIDDYIYADQNKVAPVDGSNLWYQMNNGQTIQIDANGKVTNIENC